MDRLPNDMMRWFLQQYFRKFDRTALSMTNRRFRALIPVKKRRQTDLCYLAEAAKKGYLSLVIEYCYLEECALENYYGLCSDHAYHYKICNQAVVGDKIEVLKWCFYN